uniref:hypothetical protein n=1 Tax=Polaromonas sp. W11N TaxID=1840303 RepID=UPI0015E7F7EC|nr:hypothetical protein [Polaromonas sp. W11N]
MRLSDDKFLDICQNIEAGLKIQYERNPGLTDARCAFALDQAKIAVKQRFGFAKNESLVDDNYLGRLTTTMLAG